MTLTEVQDNIAKLENALTEYRRLEMNLLAQQRAGAVQQATVRAQATLPQQGGGLPTGAGAIDWSKSGVCVIPVAERPVATRTVHVRGITVHVLGGA